MSEKINFTFTNIEHFVEKELKLGNDIVKEKSSFLINNNGVAPILGENEKLTSVRNKLANNIAYSREYKEAVAALKKARDNYHNYIESVKTIR